MAAGSAAWDGDGLDGAAAPRRSSGGGGGWRGFGGAAGPVEKLPKERRNKTLRRMLGFFAPYKAKISIVLVAILATSLIGLINPLPAEAPDRRRDPRARTGCLLNVFVGLMIILPIVSGPDRRRPELPQQRHRPVTSCRTSGRRCTRISSGCRCGSSPRRRPARSRAGWRTTSAASRSVVTDTASVGHVATSRSRSARSSRCSCIDWRLTLLSLGMLPFFMYLTYRVGKVRPRGREARRRSRLADDDRASTEETLSVSGHAADEDVRPAGRPRSSGSASSTRELAALQIRQAMVGRWFFMIIGTIFSITPAFVYWLAGYLAIQGDPTAPTIGDIVAFTTLQSRLFFPLGQLLNVQVEIHGALALFDRIFEYLELDPRSRTRPTRSALDRVDGPRRGPLP